MFDTDIQISLSKADRLFYGESAMTHAMVFTAASVDVMKYPSEWRLKDNETISLSG